MLLHTNHEKSPYLKVVRVIELFVHPAQVLVFTLADSIAV